MTGLRVFEDAFPVSPEWTSLEFITPFSRLLALKRPRDAEDFAEALLASKQRLGRYLRT